jgi:hypothetical protein
VVLQVLKPVCKGNRAIEHHLGNLSANYVGYIEIGVYLLLGFKTFLLDESNILSEKEPLVNCFLCWFYASRCILLSHKSKAF